MGHVFSYQEAVAYEQSLRDPQNSPLVDLQNQMMVDMLKPVPGRSVLGIGCGAGSALSCLADMGLHVTGLDPSPYMLDVISNRIGGRVDLHRASPEDLPFEDNAYHYVCILISLEFLEDPSKAIAEACRVGRDRLFLCAVNRYGIRGIQMWVKGKVSRTLFSHARFFSVWELIRIIRRYPGRVPLVWRTASGYAEGEGKWVHRSRAPTGPFRWWPFGTYVGLAATLTPRFRTRPLTVAYSAES